MDLVRVQREVERRLSTERFRHTLAVAETAASLAKRHGADEKKAVVAALLHDIAKEYPRNRLLKESLDFGIVLSDIELREEALIHGPLGAAIAEHEFGISDPDILAAIHFHTTGREGMSLLERIVFLADYIEPGRAFPGVDAVRDLAWTSLDKAIVLTLDQGLVYLIKRGKLIHPDAIAARNGLLLGLE